MKKKHIAVLMVTLLLIAGWTFRYVTINTYYDSLNTNYKEIYLFCHTKPQHTFAALNILHIHNEKNTYYTVCHSLFYDIAPGSREHL